MTLRQGRGGPVLAYSLPSPQGLWSALVYRWGDAFQLVGHQQLWQEVLAPARLNMAQALALQAWLTHPTGSPGSLLKLRPRHLPAPTDASLLAALSTLMAAADAVPAYAPEDPACLGPGEALNTWHAQYQRLWKSPRPVLWYLVHGVDALLLGNAKSWLLWGGVQQVASQFNGLEAPSSAHAKLATYRTDRTQGPRASLACPASLIQRDRSYRHNDPNRAFFEGLGLGGLYHNGYLELQRGTRPLLEAALKLLPERLGQLRLLAQTGQLWTSHTGPRPGPVDITQVFTAAPSFQHAPSPPLPDSVEGQLCAALVVGQYEALGEFAAVKASMDFRTADNPLPLHVTLLGQGAFRNPPMTMQKALQRLSEVLQGHEVRVYVHCWSQSDLQLARACLDKANVAHKDMEPGDFYA